MILDDGGVERLAAGTARITDDNQLLSYGAARFTRGTAAGMDWAERLQTENTVVLADAAARAQLERRGGSPSRTTP